MVVEINDLPDEVLEFILSYLPPYKDLEECQLVCKRWNLIVKNVARRSKMNLYKGLNDFRLCWKSNNSSSLISLNGATTSSSSITPPTPTIAGRFSHSAVIHENSMYIFGGGSSTDTTFNDLWRYDLSKRQWIRPLSMGSYPSPKGSATMLCYKNQLILFGGWRYPSLHPPYQPWCLFDELHLYDIKKNRWIIQNTLGYNRPPPMAGHSATIHNNKMIVFGGYQITNEINSNSNDIWCLNLDTWEWHKPEVSNIKPPPRYGQFQITLNDKILLIVGGCGGPNNMFSDAWTLNMSTDIWQWKNIPIKNKKWSATHMWCNPACRVGSKLVVLGPTPNMPNDFQIIKQQQQRPGYHPIGDRDARIIERRFLNNRLQLFNEIIPNYQRNYRLNNNNNNFNINNNNNNNNNNLNNNAIFRPNQQQPPQPPSSPPPPSQQQQQQQQNNQNNLIEDEAANRLQRNLALRSREDDSKLPKRFDEPFEDRFRMAAFNVHQPKSRNSSRERQLERVRRMEEKMNALRYSRRNSGSNNESNNSSNSNSGNSSGNSSMNSSTSSSSATSSNPTISGANHNFLAPGESNLRSSAENAVVNATLAAAAAAVGSAPAPVVAPVSAPASRNNTADNTNNKNQNEQPSPKRTKRNCLAMFVCDISNVLSDEPYLEWIEYKNYGILSGAPERLILSTIVAGNGELIMFGGVHKESLSETTHQVSNSIHFLTAPRQII